MKRNLSSQQKRKTAIVAGGDDGDAGTPCWFTCIGDQVEEEQIGRADLQRLVQKANSEAALWRQKMESGEGGVRSEEMEDMKKKFTARLLDTESQLEAALSKAASLDKANHRLRAEMEDLSIEVERVRGGYRSEYISVRERVCGF